MLENAKAYNMNRATPANVSEILARHTLCGPFDQEEYVRKMDADYKPHGGKFMDLVDKQIGLGFSSSRWRKLYAAKNSAPGMSLFVSSHQYTAYYRAILDWFVVHVPNRPESWVEVGCENGLLSMCMADLWPGSVGLGIDRVPEAILVARQLAVKFKHNRVKFSVADLGKERCCREFGPSSIVIAPFFFHEVLDTPQSNIVAKNIANLIGTQGSLVSFNRFADSGRMLPALVDMLSQSRLRVTASSELTVGAEVFSVVQAVPLG